MPLLILLLLFSLLFILLVLSRLIRLRIRFQWTNYDRTPTSTSRRFLQPPVPTFLRVEAPVEEYDIEDGNWNGKGIRTLQGAVREAVLKGERERVLEREREMGWGRGKDVF
ncbi:MAG: hypothetical protein Q9180_002056 [Flavoplaca navasiana]